MKNIKSLYKTTILLCFAILLVGCEDSIEGINTDPLAATSISAELLMPQVLVAGLSANRTIELNSMNMHSQSWSATVGFGVFANPERYNISANTTNNVWVGQYTTALRNLQQMRVLTETNNPEALNIIGQAQVLEAFAYLNLTQIFGDIPFSEAIQVADFSNPNFDSQEDVLRGLPALLDQALQNLSSDTGIIESADLVYGGDRASWVRFANSLKLKCLMLIANVDAASVQAEIQNTANQPLILDASQDAVLNYTAVPGNENPIWKTIDQFGGGVNTFWGGGIPLIDIMNANSDPRRATYFDTNEDGDYVGQEQGVFSTTGVSTISLNIIRPEMPDRYSTAAETNFYLAEAALLGYINGDANAFYRAGITASLDSYDGAPGAISEADKAAFLASPRGTISGDSEEDALLKIHEETFVANFTRAIESWTDWRRNDVPTITLPTGAVLTDFLRRYQIPLSEVTSNANAPAVEDLTEPMWFEN
ncbi:SusD/RagB family nutrient-binding outer membrane lipoprotein [Hyunsoonleella sp. 2307UL5-6]|uniref:SusD/RagB family nutrient-binding outer membrane lipoprotein n=1 Tax=Hyunsoonleella sp. 2307UL5-6 TaxID=3384768 RepID=UPI0039BC4134